MANVCEHLTRGILIYIQKGTKLHSLFYRETALHISGGTITHHQERKTTVSTAYGICHTLLLSALSKVPLFKLAPQRHELFESWLRRIHVSDVQIIPRRLLSGTDVVLVRSKHTR